MALGCKFPHLDEKIQRSPFGLVTMTNVDGLIAPKRILGDIRGVVSNPSKGVSDKYKVQVTGH
jgi:hypothetical protein